MLEMGAGRRSKIDFVCKLGKLKGKGMLPG